MTEVLKLSRDILKEACESIATLCNTLPKYDISNIQNKILIAENDVDVGIILRITCEHLHYLVSIVETVEGIKRELQNNFFCFAVLDEYLNGGQASSVLDEIVEHADKVIFITAAELGAERLRLLIKKNIKYKDIEVYDKPSGLKMITDMLLSRRRNNYRAVN